MSGTNALRPTQNPQTRFGQPGTPVGLAGPRMAANALQVPQAAPSTPNALMAPQPQQAAMAPPVQAATPAIRETPRSMEGVEHRVSTRIPTAKGAADAHQDAGLQISHEAMRAHPDSYRRNMDAIRVRYPHINTTALSNDEVAHAFMDHLHDNIVHLWNKVPTDTWRENAINWYKGANTIAKGLNDKFDISHRQAAAVIASMSPQKDWDQNVELAHRLLTIRAAHQDTAVTPEMRDFLQRQVDQRKTPRLRDALQREADQLPVGIKLSQLSDPIHQAMFIRAHDEAHNPDRSYQIISPTGERMPGPTTKAGEPQKMAWGSFGEVANAMKALQGDHLPGISRALGSNDKVRSFYNNIIAPDAPHGDVTVDTHAINVGQLRPMGSKDFYVPHGLGTEGSASNATGAGGLYGLYADAYRRAADTISRQEGRRFLPREVQSVTWEAVRNLFDNKAHKAVDKETGEPTHKVGLTARDAWNAVRFELIHPDMARDLIHTAAGGINTPAWYRATAART